MDSIPIFTIQKRNLSLFPLLKRDFEDGGATPILQIALLNRDLLTCWYRLAWYLTSFQKNCSPSGAHDSAKYKANLGVKGLHPISHISYEFLSGTGPVDCCS